MAKKENNFNISGRVLASSTGEGIAGLRVEAWDKDLIFNDLVGSAVSDVEGHFRIEFSGSYFRELFFDRKPDLFFKVFSAQKLIKNTQDSVLWNVSAGLTPVEIMVPWVNAPSMQSGNDRLDIVSGTVTSPDRASVGGLRVEIVDKNVGQDVSLAESVTDKQGNYRASFPASVLSERQKMKPDLQARVFSGEKFLAASEVIYNATEQETLNVILPANSTAVASEHETLTDAISDFYDGRLKDLKETDDRQDISYLANKTGWDARAVALAALGDQFSQHAAESSDAPAIKPAFYYALFRAGLPANEDTLYTADTQLVERIWKQAIEQRVIPQAIEQEIGNAVTAFQKLSERALLTGPSLVGASSLKEMLAASELDDGQQKQFAELYAAHRSDLPEFWKAVEGAFGTERKTRLQLDGKLGLLTINNAPLIRAVHNTTGANGLAAPVDLARQGYHRASKWSELLRDDVPTPKEIPGDTPEAKRANYAEYLGAQVRLSFPTASVAEMVQAGDLPVNRSEEVHAFLSDHQGKFEIGMQPVGQYIKQNQLDIADETVAQVKRLQRVYQLTPSDEAMTGLMRRGVDAASHVVKFEKETFIETFAADLGGTEMAARTYDKARQVHGAVLNIAISYLNAKNGIELGAPPTRPRPGGSQNGNGQIIKPEPNGPTDESANDIIAYPTLEQLFGEMDFCACDHCRSVLSPAAYLVDLLLFIDRPPAEANTENPQTVLFQRRPDIQHLPLTCENTNTALPYIDVVNEALEYFIANNVTPLSLNGYKGHDTDAALSEDLLASPQSFSDGVRDAAYTILRGERFPPPLPFHQPLENLRSYFDKFEVPLTLALERFRKSDILDVDRTNNPAPPLTDYAWRDILIEELRLSRAEHEILTDSNAVPLWRVYGFANGTTDAAVIAALSNAKNYTRRMGITYEDIVAILKTRFVNPNSDLVPKLERLGVSFSALKRLKDNNTAAADAEFDALLPTGANAPNPAEYDNDIKLWVRKQENFDRIMRIITLLDPDSNVDQCNFDNLEFRFAEPITNENNTRLTAVEFVRLVRFIRLWKKLGWTIEQTDAAICALFPVHLFPLRADAIDTTAKLDAGFLMLLTRLGIVVRILRLLNLTPKRDLLPLLTLWSPLGVHGAGALYRQMFLSPALLQQDAAFSDNGYGQFLQDNTQTLLGHAEALRSAFNLTRDEFDRIVEALAFDANTLLTIENISAVYRRGWLARKLKLSVRELLLLIQLTGLDPFTAPNPTDASVLRLIAFVQLLKDRSLNSAAALYLIWNQDLSGKSTPEFALIADFVRTLRRDFAAIESEFAVKDDPDGTIAQARMTQVYGIEAATFFFGLIDDTLSVEVNFTDPDDTFATEALRLAVEAAAGASAAGQPRIAYDDFRKKLSYSGLLSAATRDAIKLAGGGTAAFSAAVDDLFTENQTLTVPFFARYPELQPLYDNYVSSNDPVEAKRTALLNQILPDLVRRRKQQQTLLTISAVGQTTLEFARALLDTSSQGHALHAAGQNNQPALNDILALETQGFSVEFFASDTATGIVIPSASVASNLDYAPAPGGGGNPLPANPVPNTAISGVWRGLIEAPETGFFNFRIETDPGATVTLVLDEKNVPLTQNGTLFRNTTPIELRAGALYRITLTIEKVTQIVHVQWEWQPKGQGRTNIPPRYLYPSTLFDAFRQVYLRFLKATALSAALRLSANELAHFATHPDYRINAQGQLNNNSHGWLNALPTADNLHLANAAEAAIAQTLNATLLTPLRDLLDFSRIKNEISADDESLLAVLEDPATATQNSDSLLFSLTRWNKQSLDDLLTHFSGNIGRLAGFNLFRRVYDAFALIQLMGISGEAVIRATTNEPEANTVRDFQAALRARYDAADWRTVVQPINDEMRGLQRDALVAYILHRMRSNPATAHIDTVDKLFEFFLMDVQIEPCMQTSRTRHALSSVQLFIERCLMNLERDVSSASINAKRWEWMKRYRVWEANRKVFLFPENWLEPELRDDKSPFFKEIESELLQSDITEDTAAVAMLNYLSKLEEVAKLEPCGIYNIPGNTIQQTNEVDHVIARTAGAQCKYYYRRHENGSWTAWDQIGLDIEDNPLIPVVWRDRLLLFWLRIMKKGDEAAFKPSVPQNTKLVDLTNNSLPSEPTMTTQAVLCWSEYFNGKWQPVKTSSLKLPTVIWRAKEVSGNIFDRKDLVLTLGEREEALRVGLEYEGGWSSFFLLYNTHSLPVRSEDQPESGVPFPQNFRVASEEDDRFTLTYFGELFVSPLAFSYDPIMQRKILKPWQKFRIVQTHQEYPTFDSPFFYEDSRHIFFVQTRQKKVRIFDLDDFGIVVNPGVKRDSKFANLVTEFDPNRETEPEFWGDGGPVGPDTGIFKADAVQRFVTEDAHINWALGSVGTVKFGDRQIGPAGAILNGKRKI